MYFLYFFIIAQNYLQFNLFKTSVPFEQSSAKGFKQNKIINKDSINEDRVFGEVERFEFT